MKYDHYEGRRVNKLRILFSTIKRKTSNCFFNIYFMKRKKTRSVDFESESSGLADILLEQSQ